MARGPPRRSRASALADTCVRASARATHSHSAATDDTTSISQEGDMAAIPARVLAHAVGVEIPELDARVREGARGEGAVSGQCDGVEAAVRVQERVEAHRREAGCRQRHPRPQVLPVLLRCLLRAATAQIGQTTEEEADSAWGVGEVHSRQRYFALDAGGVALGSSRGHLRLRRLLRRLGLLLRGAGLRFVLRLRHQTRIGITKWRVVTYVFLGGKGRREDVQEAPLDFAALHGLQVLLRGARDGLVLLELALVRLPVVHCSRTLGRPILS